MSYTLRVPKYLEKEILRLKKRDSETHKELFRKVDRILSDPHHFSHPLRSRYKGVWETHIGNKVLFYKIDEATRTVELVNLIDHDLL